MATASTGQGNAALCKTGGGLNSAGVSNAEVDSLLDQLLVGPDRPSR